MIQESLRGSGMFIWIYWVGENTKFIKHELSCLKICIYTHQVIQNLQYDSWLIYVHFIQYVKFSNYLFVKE